MKMRRWMMLAIITLLFVTVACSQGTNGNGGSVNQGTNEQPKPNNSQSETEAVEDDEPAEIVFYSTSRDSEEVFNERYGDALRKQFPHYTIKYIQRVPDSTDLNLLITSREKIDIIFDSIGSFAGSVINHGMSYDMTELIEQHGVDLSRFEPSLIDAMKQISGGAVYGLPVENSTNVLFYNKDIFETYGVDYPWDGMTWEDLHDLANQLNIETDGTVYVGYTPSVNHMVLMNSYSWPLIDPETNRSTFNDEIWKKIIEAEFLATNNNTTVQKAMEQYRDGRALNSVQFYKDRILAMFPAGQLFPIVMKDDLSQMNWDMVAMPTYEDNPGVGQQSYPIYFAITSQAENKDAAMKVLKYLVSDEFQMEHSKKGNMTSLTNPDIIAAMGSESEFKDKNYGAFFYNEFAPIRPIAEIESKISPLYALTNRLVGLVNGEYDINTALRMAEEEVAQMIDGVTP